MKCEKCGAWHKAAEPCHCSEHAETTQSNESTEKTTLCVICGKESYGQYQCKACRTETLAFVDELDKNSTIREYRDYYYNLKDRIFIMKDLETTQRYCNKLVAIAYAAWRYCKDNSLRDRVFENCVALIESKKTSPVQEKYREEKQEQDEKKAKICTAEDGHVARSDMEVIIDNALYNSFILHVYEPNITEISECRKKADWFIPILNGKGIYIEYWGMDTKEYQKSKDEKIALYEKYNIPYIGIEKDDPKGDYQTFKSNLIRDITKLATERYKHMPSWE